MKLAGITRCLFLLDLYWVLLIYSTDSILKMLMECHSGAANGINWYNKKHKVGKINFSNVLIIINSILKSCRTNVGSTRYLKENGWHYVGICRACWATGVGPASNQPLTIKSARWAKNRDSVIWQRGANKMPTLAQWMIAIWGIFWPWHLTYFLNIRA